MAWWDDVSGNSCGCANGLPRIRAGLGFALRSATVDELVTVTEKKIAKAILRLLEIEKTVVEGLRRLSCSRALKGIWVVRTN